MCLCACKLFLSHFLLARRNLLVLYACQLLLLVNLLWMFVRFTRTIVPAFFGSVRPLVSVQGDEASAGDSGGQFLCTLNQLRSKTE